MSRNAVVVTGVGVVSALGATPEALFDALVRGESGVAPLDWGDFPVRGAARVIDPGPLGSVSRSEADDLLERQDRIALFSMLAARRAVRHAFGHEGAMPGGRGGSELFMGVGLASSCVEEIEADVLPHVRGEDDYDYDAAGRAIQLGELRWSYRHLTDEPARLVASRHGCRGYTVQVGACAAAAMAIGDAFRAVRAGRVERALAGGADAMIHPPGVISFQRLGALSERAGPIEAACRPFDAERDGFVMGEGAAFFVLETEETARARGARILARLSGFATSVDGYRITDPEPQGRGVVAALRGALADAGLQAEQVGYINAHGTGTVANDRIESAAIQQVFGAAAPPTSSTKAATGHLIAAAGAIELAITIEALRCGVLPPTLNWSDGGADCPLDAVPRARRAELTHALSSSFGFGGQNAVLIASRDPSGARELELPAS